MPGKPGPQGVRIINEAPPTLAMLVEYLEGLTDAELAASWTGLVVGLVMDEGLSEDGLDLASLARVLNIVGKRSRRWCTRRECMISLNGWPKRISLKLDEEQVELLEALTRRTNRGAGRIMGDILRQGLARGYKGQAGKCR